MNNNKAQITTPFFNDTKIKEMFNRRKEVSKNIRCNAVDYFNGVQDAEREMQKEIDRLKSIIKQMVPITDEVKNDLKDKLISSPLNSPKLIEQIKDKYVACAEISTIAKEAV